MKRKKPVGHKISVTSYADLAVPHLAQLVQTNEKVMTELSERLVKDVIAGRSLLVFGSGHSGLFPLELYHRAGGASFVIPLVADYLLPHAGPPVVRTLERTSAVANSILNRVEPKKGEMLWLASQSGINTAVVDLALEARKRGLFTVAFTSLVHSRSVASRHSSGKKLFEVCDRTVDLGGRPGDAIIPLGPSLSAGPVSGLGAILLGHSILVATCAELESRGRRCVYTSVNTPDGERRNRAIEEVARKRDVLLR